LFIVSEYKLGGTMEEAPANAPKYEHTAVVVAQATGETCERCWVVSETVGSNADHPTLCERCGEVVKEHYVK
jgi:isoleucyl-tRNA synthetase